MGADQRRGFDTFGTREEWAATRQLDDAMKAEADEARNGLRHAADFLPGQRMPDALTALTLANALVTAAIVRWVMTRHPEAGLIRELTGAAEEQTAAVAAVQREIENPPEAR